MKAFLTMKHWQLFLLLFGIPVIGGIISIFLILINPGAIGIFAGIVVVNAVTYALLISWQYSVVYNLNKLLPDGVTLNMTLFKICLTVPFFVLAIAYFIFYDIISTAFSDNGGVPVWDFRWLVSIFFLSIVSMAASVYVLYTMSNALVAVEKQQQVHFSDFVVEFIFFWFWVIGIWFLQPRINAIFNDPGDVPSLPVMPPPVPG